MRPAAFDVQTLGRGAIALVAATALLCAAVVVYASRAYAPATAGRVLTACLEELLPLACGIAAAGVVAGDRTLELQATSRGTAARLALVRVGGIVALCAPAGAAVVALAASLGVASTRAGAGEIALTLLAPATLLAALAFATSIAARSASAAAALVAGVWTAENAANALLSTGPLDSAFLFATTYTPDAAGWGENRMVLLVLAAALLAAGAVALNRPGTVLQLVRGDAS